MFRLGTRRSLLAKTQSENIRSRLANAGLAVELVEISSDGDRDRKNPLYEIESSGPGLFTKALQDALLAGQIELAVHSLKDLPTEEPAGLTLASVPERVSAEDCLLIHPDFYHRDRPLKLAAGATVGTSSLRREALLLSMQSDLKVQSIRGNVPTRLQLVLDGKIGAVVLAQAGLTRLQLSTKDLVCVPLAEDQFVPAPGQGALAVESRQDAKPALRQALAAMENASVRCQVTVERQILRSLEGGCSMPLGVRCFDLGGGNWRIVAFLGTFSQGADKTRQWHGFHRFDQTASDLPALQREACRTLEPFARAQRKQ